MDKDKLAKIGEKCLLEHQAWVERNLARRKYRKFLHDYENETGEWFDEDDCEAEDSEMFDNLKKLRIQSQRKLTTARAATKRELNRQIKT